MAAQLVLQAVLADVRVKFLPRVTPVRLLGILVRDQLEQRPAKRLDVRRMRFDLHAVSERCRARDRRPAPPGDLYETQAATTVRLESIVVAQGGHAHVGCAQCVKNRPGLLALRGALVDYDAKHDSSSGP